MVLKWKIIVLINVSRSLRAVIGITETSSLRLFNETLYLRHFVIGIFLLAPLTKPLLSLNEQDFEQFLYNFCLFFQIKCT